MFWRNKQSRKINNLINNFNNPQSFYSINFLVLLMNYEELKEKYNLPSYDELDFEFELDKEAKYPLRDIRRKINSKLHIFLDILQSIIQPETSDLTQMYEAHYYTEEDKQKALNLYKRLMIYSRTSDEIAIKYNEEDEANFINELFQKWEEIKDEMYFFIKKMKNSWKQEYKVDDDMRYLG